MPVRSARAGNVQFGEGRPLAVIAGPCVIESQELIMHVAERLSAISKKLGFPLVFKSSFDKANRSSGKSFRGPGIGKGLAILADVKAKWGLPILTDIHDIAQVGPAAEVVDVLQIPAFLARQTDLIVAAAKTGRCVNVKKGQFMAPWDMKQVALKCREAGNENVLLTERGTTFGYGLLINDMRSIPWMQETGCPVIFDATHSVQMPGGLGDRSGGDRKMIPTLARAAVAAGCDGLFLETHPNPDQALSDGPNMIPLDDFPNLIKRCLSIRAAMLDHE